jgi:hypothetical protein
VTDLAELQGKSRAAVIMDVLDATAPSLIFLRDTLRKANSVPEQLRLAVLEAVGNAERGMAVADEIRERSFDLISDALTEVNRTDPVAVADESAVHLAVDIARGAGSHDG